MCFIYIYMLYICKCVLFYLCQSNNCYSINILHSKSRPCLDLFYLKLEVAFYCLECYMKTQSTWTLLSDYRVSLEPPLLSLHSPSYDAPPFPLKKKRADRVPGTFLLGSAHICWLTPHHRAALKPSEEAEALAPSVSNGRWLGHEKADAGGSGLTFLREHHKNFSNKALTVTFKFKQTLETQQRWKVADLFTWHIITPPFTYFGEFRHQRHIYCRFVFWLYSFSLFSLRPVTMLYNWQRVHLPLWKYSREVVMDPLSNSPDVASYPLALLVPYCRKSQFNLHFIIQTYYSRSNQEFTEWYKVKLTESLE